MHRRPISQLSRRHAVDWPSAARFRLAAYSSRLIDAPRRHFHPSLSILNSSGPSSSDNGADTLPASTPKFGNRWGSKLAQQASVLSPEEQAIRKTLLAKSDSIKQQQQRPSPPPSQNSQVTSRQRPRSMWAQVRSAQAATPQTSVPNNRRSEFFTDEESQSLQPRRRFEVNAPLIPKRLRNTDWICPDCQYECFGKHLNCPKCSAPRPRAPPKHLRNSDWTCSDCQYECFGKHLNCPKCDAPRPHASRPHAPNYLRNTDWTCPDCRYECFGKHLNCPKCNALRPDAPTPPSLLSRRAEAAGESIKIRKLSQADPDDQVEPTRRERTFRGYMSQKGERAGDTEMGEDEGEHAHRRRHSKAEKSKKPTEKAAKTEEKDPWSWDASSLDRLELSSQDVEHGKPSKRKEGRRAQHQSKTEEEDYDPDEHRRTREQRKRQKKQKAKQKELESPPSPLYLPEFISVSNLADVIGVRPAQFVRRMEEMGFEDVSYSHVLDAETAGLVAAEYNFEPIFEATDDDLMAAPEPEDTSIFPSRPPVVTIMGHVDHGKTTILDWLRQSSIAASEHGGITQHIGAFSVAMPSGKTITFLDTPGHAAFLEMRRRGADVTDIIVLVVAADDSVKPQTIEAIKHATGARVPIIVAISKIDKENVNPEKVKQDLSVHGVHVEDYGGDVQAIGVSGKTGQGMLELEEAIITLSEVLDHRADPHGATEGWVIEATTKSYGRVATTLVRRGTLRPGDIIVAGNTWARVRTLRNEAGVSIPEATPGTPVEVDGWRDQPSAGTEFLQATDEQQAKDVVEYRQEKSETQKLSQDTAAINEARREQVEKRRQEELGSEEAAESTSSGPKPVHFIIKADVGGSAEAVLNSVTAIGNNEVYANVLRSEVGPISEFDIEHAASADGHIISFNMPIDPAMSRLAENRRVKILDHNIIYKLIDDVKGALSEHLAPLVSQRVTGEAEIGQVFDITLKGREKTAIAGCKVRNGLINRSKKVRVIRGEETIYDGTINSLKNVKKDVTEMRKDTECGIGFEGWTDFAVGDHVQCYEEIYEKRYL